MLCFAVSALIVVTRKALNLKDKLVEVNERTEVALDVLDASYNRMCSILNTPVASDDPYIKSVVESIKVSREAVLLVAEKLSRQEVEESEQE